MKSSNQGDHMMFVVLCLMALQLSFGATLSFGETLQPLVQPDEKFRLGERMYREGILPSGEPMHAFIKGDLPVPGTAFTCVSCHLRSGLGSFEGGVYTPATTGALLFEPLQKFPERSRTERDPKKWLLVHRRPAYTEASLAEALRNGIDPAGRILDESMPRYSLTDEDMAVMTAYLKSLSSRPSPGISDAGIKFATVVTDDVSPEDRDAMLVSLLGFIDSRNTQARQVKRLTALGKGNFVVMGGMGASMLPSISQSLELSIWLLKGPQETWRGQLEEYYRKEPVFALIGGITKGEWRPIHEFSEDNRIPCLFPNTDLPMISRTDWYTLYLSKGYYQEGDSAARYLGNLLLKNRPIVQIVRDSREGRALSTGFQEAWQDMGRGALVTLTLKPGETLTRSVLKKMLAKEKPVALVLWDGQAALPELEALAGDKNRPERVFISSTYLGKGLWSLKDKVRDFTYITYPFRLEDKADPNTMLAFSAEPTKGSNQGYILAQVLTMALMDMDKNYYRENFLDVIGMRGDMKVPLYERLSFGPGQRYASKGCYIVQLSKGEKPELIRKSDWVIH